MFLVKWEQNERMFLRLLDSNSVFSGFLCGKHGKISSVWYFKMEKTYLIFYAKKFVYKVLLWEQMNSSFVGFL